MFKNDFWSKGHVRGHKGKTSIYSPHFSVTLVRRDVPVGVPLDLSTPTGISCIGTYGENCKSDNVSKYRVLLVAFLLLWHEN